MLGASLLPINKRGHIPTKVCTCRWRLARSHQLGIAAQYLFGLGASRVARIGPQETVQFGVSAHDRLAVS
jgi:hypothetical protein